MGKVATPKQTAKLRELCSELGLSLSDEIKRVHNSYAGDLDQLPSVVASVVIGCLLEEAKEANAEKRAYFKSARESKFVRCNSSRRCKICGRKRWCSETGNGEFAVCVKQAAGSILTTKKGHFVHPLTTKYQPTPAGRPAPPPSHAPPAARPTVERPAPTPEEAERLLHRRHTAYQALISISPSTLAPDLLIYGDGGLSERCLLDKASAFGMMPATAADRAALTRRLTRAVAELDRTLLADALLPGNPLAGVPGFWTGAGGFTLWWRKDQKGPCLVIPYQDLRGRIHGCQLRIPHAPKDRRYVWLSSVPMEEDGPSPGSPIHVVQSTLSPDGSPREVLVTEGALKAECSALFLKLYAILATAGVSCSHDEILAACLAITQKRKRVIIAFDSDHRKNKDVCYQIASLAVTLLNAGLNVLILTWPEDHKGLDDALIATSGGRRVEFSLLTPRRWLSSLPEKPAEIRERAIIPFEQQLVRPLAA